MTDGLGNALPRTPPGQLIQLEYCERYGITLAEMKSVRRTRRVAVPRMEAMVEVRRRLGYSYPQIGRMFNRDHTTVVHACRKAGILGDPTASEVARRAAHKRNLMIKLVEAAL